MNDNFEEEGFESPVSLVGATSHADEIKVHQDPAPGVLRQRVPVQGEVLYITWACGWRGFARPKLSNSGLRQLTVVFQKVQGRSFMPTTSTEQSPIDARQCVAVSGPGSKNRSGFSREATKLRAPRCYA
jgi:hypothetical protein